jgi:ribosome recycling factor
MSMLDDVMEELRGSIEKAHDSLRRELSRLRTGRANPDLLDSIRVDYYGTPTQIGKMATVAVPEARMLTIKAWDKTQVRAIDKAIREAGIGLNPMIDGELIRVPMPQLSEERRKELVKIAKKAGEESKVAIRKARHEAKDMIDTLDVDGEISGDEADRARKKVEDVIVAGTTKVDEILAKKEKDILEV